MQSNTDELVRRLVIALESTLTAAYTPVQSPTVFDAIEEFCEEKRVGGAAKRTVQTYRQRLRTFADVYGYTAVGDVTHKDIARYVNAMRSQSHIYQDHPKREAERGSLSPKTVSGRIQSVKTFFRWCEKREYCVRSPARDIPRRDPDPSVDSRAMEPETLRRMMAVARSDATLRNEPRNLALLSFLADTGCRVGELVKLPVADLDTVRQSAVVSGKTGPREVFYTKQTSRALDYWLSVRPDCDHDYVFCSISDRNAGVPMTTNAVYLVCRTLAERAGVEGKRFNPHAIRHLVGQHFTDNSNLELARKKLGHASITTTGKYYANQDRKRLIKATEDLSLLRDEGEEDKRTE